MTRTVSAGQLPNRKRKATNESKEESDGTFKRAQTVRKEDDTPHAIFSKLNPSILYISHPLEPISLNADVIQAIPKAAELDQGEPSGSTSLFSPRSKIRSQLKRTRSAETAKSSSIRTLAEKKRDWGIVEDFF